MFTYKNQQRIWTQEDGLIVKIKHGGRKERRKTNYKTCKGEAKIRMKGRKLKKCALKDRLLN
jgi:hypothetical protein